MHNLPWSYSQWAFCSPHRCWSTGSRNTSHSRGSPLSERTFSQTGTPCNSGNRNVRSFWPGWNHLMKHDKKRGHTVKKSIVFHFFFGNNDVLQVKRFFHVALFCFHLSCSRCQDYKLPDETDINNHYQSCLETVNSCPIAYQRSPRHCTPTHPSVRIQLSAPEKSVACHRVCVPVSVCWFERHSQ